MLLQYSHGDPYAAVCSRGDLAKHPVPKGCLDSKITNYQLALKRVSEAVVGPTAQGHLPPFSWQGRHMTPLAPSSLNRTLCLPFANPAHS